MPTNSNKTMKTIIKLIPTLVILATLVYSCDKSEKEDNLGPTIVINTPEANAEFCSGRDTVKISATISDNDELHNIYWEITSGETILAIGSAHSHDSPYELRTEWLTNTKEHTNAKLTITASDHNDNENVASVDFHIHEPGSCHD